MSEHGHDEHGGHGGHGSSEPAHAAKSHDSHGHDDHGHGGHGGGHGGLGDYNTEPPGPSTLPAVPWWGLMVMGAVQFFLLGMIVSMSLALGAGSGPAGEEGHAKSHGAAAPEAHGAHTDKKE